MTGHLLAFEDLPGSWRWPVEPCERCDTDTPWVASRPRKLWRFMTPAKPLPMVVPVTSTILADDEMGGAELGADFEHGVGGHAELDHLLGGSTFATAKWPRSALPTFFTLAWPEPSWTAE